MTVRDIRDLLETQPTFAGLAADELDVIAGCGRNVHIPAGTSIFREGEAADTFFVIREGRAAVEIRVPQGGALVLDTLGPGEVLGWSWLFAPYRWHFDARAADDIRAIALDGECLRGKCDDDPRLGYDLMQRFAQLMLDRLQSARVRLLDLYGSRGSR
ncbi:MAG: cyclic nucleotide-binding domain-containing protein [Acidimicrobiia bacterium]